MNQHRLLSHYDVYHTLSSLVRHPFPGAVRGYVGEDAAVPFRAIDILSEAAAPSRPCAEAGIEDGTCVRTQWEEMQVTAGSVAVDVAASLLDLANEDLARQVGKSLPGTCPRCARLHLDRVLSARQRRRPPSVFRYVSCVKGLTNSEWFQDKSFGECRAKALAFNASSFQLQFPQGCRPGLRAARTNKEDYIATPSVLLGVSDATQHHYAGHILCWYYLERHACIFWVCLLPCRPRELWHSEIDARDGGHAAARGRGHRPGFEVHGWRGTPGRETWRCGCIRAVLRVQFFAGRGLPDC